jgi:hypothetical protein
MQPYNHTKAGDDSFMVTGVHGDGLYGLTSLTEPQAKEIAWHLNLAFYSGRREAQTEMKRALGIT